MKRVIISAVVAAAVAVPAVIGLWGNASFSQAVPVRAPVSGQVVAPAPGSTPGTVDDNGGDTTRDLRTEPGDDRDVQGTPPQPSSSPSPSPAVPGVDDHGGDTPRDQRVEPGDDRGGSDSSSGGGDDDHGGHGSDD